MNQVTLEVFYPHSPERVWQALTDRRALTAWMMDNDFEPQLGHKFHFRQAALPGFDRYIHCEVIELEPPNRLAYRWQDAQTQDSAIVTWTLTAVSGGTTLQLRHHQLVQTTAMRPSVLLPRSRAISDSIPQGKEYDPTNTLTLGSGNDALRTLQPPSSILLAPECRELQAEWNHRLIRLTRTLIPDGAISLAAELSKTE